MTLRTDDVRSPIPDPNKENQMSPLSDVLTSTSRRIQGCGADLLMSASGRTPFSRAVETGIGVESIVTRAWATYQEQTARMLGYADRREVRRLRELVRELEFRVETLESEITSATASEQGPTT